MKLFDDVEVIIDHKLDKDFNKMVIVTVMPLGMEKFILIYPLSEASFSRLEKDVKARLGRE